MRRFVKKFFSLMIVMVMVCSNALMLTFADAEECIYICDIDSNYTIYKSIYADSNYNDLNKVKELAGSNGILKGCYPEKDEKLDLMPVWERKIGSNLE